MKPQLWLPTVVFLAVSIPLVLLMNLLNFGGDYKVWIAIAAGALATAYTQKKLKNKGDAE
jgi:4-hydroxybenzoate polyprenyltransferase